MALYLGSSEINPVETVEVIKEVPTEQDLTLMGNELRRAYCWSRQVNVNGLCCFYDSGSNKVSSYFNASNVYLGIKNFQTMTWSSPYTTSVVIDGKLYDINSSSSSISLTQFGTDTDWNKTLYGNSIVSKNGYIYSNKSSLTTSLGQEYNDFKCCYGYNGSTLYINNGKLMSSSTVKHNGNWLIYYCYFPSNYGIGVLNNKITSYKIDSNSIGSTLNYTITNENLISVGLNVPGVYFAIDNTLYYYIHDYSTGTFSFKSSYNFDYKIKKILMNELTYNSSCYVLLENGDLYKNNNTLAYNNIKDIFLGTDVFCLSNDNKIYSVNNNTLKYTFNYNVEICNLNSKSHFIQCFKVVDDSPVTTYYNQYTIQYVDDMTKSYSAYDSDEDIYNISAQTTSSITVNGNEYTRNGSEDAVFTFVPEDLENHTFTDTDLLQAYLDAGIRQQQNNT